MNKTLPALPGKAPALPPGAEIGYTAHDGAQHRVPLAEAAVVRFAGGATVSGCDLKILNGGSYKICCWLERSALTRMHRVFR